MHNVIGQWYFRTLIILKMCIDKLELKNDAKIGAVSCLAYLQGIKKKKNKKRRNSRKIITLAVCFSIGKDKNISLSINAFTAALGKIEPYNDRLEKVRKLIQTTQKRSVFSSWALF